MSFDELYRRTQSATGNPIAAEWRDAARGDLPGLEMWIQRVSFDDCFLFEIYEALAASDVAPIAFLVREFDRLISCAERTPRNPEIYAQLLAFSYLDGAPDAKSHILAALSARLDSPLPQIRRMAAILLAHFLDGTNPGIVRKLRESVAGDSDWRVRYMAFRTLHDIQLDDPRVEPPPRLSVLDRVRVMALGEASAGNIAA